MSLNPDQVDKQYMNSTTQGEACYHCEGYYGSSIGDPLCEICHDFLYVEHFNISLSQQNWGYISQTETEKDDGDSGNDEPSEDAPPTVAAARFPRNNHNENVQDENLINACSAELPAIDVPNTSNMHRENRVEQSSSEEPPGSTPVASGSKNQTLENSPMDEVFPSINSTSESREQERTTRRINLLTTPLATYQKAPEVDLTSMLPPEIWRMIFQKLDPVSLLLASRARLRWKSIILELVPNETWRSFVVQKWPLFSPIYEVMDWYQVFVSFLESLSCCSCWIKMNIPSISAAVGDQVLPFRSLRSVRLAKELKWLTSDHPDGIEAMPLDHLNYNWLARIIGPPQSPYQGGVFYLNIKIPHDYPLKPPLVRFLTKVYHPNISRHGDIGIDCIQHNWTLALFIPQTLLSIQSLLTDPCEPCMEPAIGRLRQRDRKAFEREARTWTWKYAMTDVLLT